MLLVAAVLVVAGSVGMLIPVSVSGPSGESIGCGNTVANDLSAAKAADDKAGANVPLVNQFIPQSRYVAACDTALGNRRTWTIPVTVIGVIVMAAVLAPGPRVRARAEGVSLPQR
jgi:hypothetical protein